MRGRRLEGTKVDRDRQRQQVIEEVEDRQATEGRNCGSAKGSKQEKSSSCYGGKSQGEVGGLYIVGYFDASLRMGKDHKGRDERNTKDKVGPER